MIELAVTLKNPDRRYTHKHLVYDEMRMNAQDPIILGAIKEAQAIFGDDYDSITIKAMMVL